MLKLCIESIPFGGDMIIYLKNIKIITAVCIFLLLLLGCQNSLKSQDTLLVKVDNLYLDQQFPTYKSYIIETEEDICM